MTTRLIQEYNCFVGNCLIFTLYFISLNSSQPFTKLHRQTTIYDVSRAAINIQQRVVYKEKCRGYFCTLDFLVKHIYIVFPHLHPLTWTREVISLPSNLSRHIDLSFSDWKYSYFPGTATKNDFNDIEDHYFCLINYQKRKKFKLVRRLPTTLNETKPYYTNANVMVKWWSKSICQ